MLSTVAVGPARYGDGVVAYESVHVPFTLFLRLLDARTGEPAVHVHAQVQVNGRPWEHWSVLDRRHYRQFRVLSAWKMGFQGRKDNNNPYETFDVPIYCLRKWQRTSNSGPLEPTHEYVGEFFDVVDDAEILVSDTGHVFYPVAGNRWVLVRIGNTILARRDLVTDDEGILRIPVSIASSREGTRYNFRFRDHLCLRAKGEFDPRVTTGGTGAMRVRLSGEPRENRVELSGKPSENHWVASVGTSHCAFDDKIELKIGDWRHGLDEALWVVRGVSPIPSGATQRVHNRDLQPRGIVVHFNSGFDTQEKLRDLENVPEGPPTWRNCPTALKEGANDFIWHPELPHRVLKAMYDETNNPTDLGYHYLIDRKGTIWAAADESKRTAHAGFQTRIPESVPAPGTPPTHIFAVADRLANATINHAYIGICPIGNHQGDLHHFTDAQHWYLDRLIENIRERHAKDDAKPDVPWYQILGHDEIDTATPPRKPDPGAALIGGMAALRGRHRV